MFVKLGQILHIIFELTLFFLLSVVLHKIFKSTIYPPLRTYIRGIKEKWDNLKNQKNLVHKTRLSLDDKIEKQREGLHLIEGKIEKWHTAVSKQQEQQTSEEKKIIKKIIEKKRIQKKELHNIKLQLEAIPKAVDLSHKELQKRYEGKEGSVLLEKLIMRLKEHAD